MQISVKTLAGETITLGWSRTPSDIAKSQIQAKEGIPTEAVRGLAHV